MSMGREEATCKVERFVGQPRAGFVEHFWSSKKVKYLI